MTESSIPITSADEPACMSRLRLTESFMFPSQRASDWKRSSFFYNYPRPNFADCRDRMSWILRHVIENKIADYSALKKDSRGSQPEPSLIRRRL